MRPVLRHEGLTLNIRLLKKIKVMVPATSANLGPGFDVLGVSLKLYNEVAVELYSAAVENNIEISGEGAATLPRNENNVVWRSMKEVFASSGPSFRNKFTFKNFKIRLINRIPLASGMGSSAAARLCGILAANELTGAKLDCDGLLSIGVKLEGHPDNIVPALLGGLCVSAMDGKRARFVKLPVPAMKAVVCNPDFELATEKTRKVLPRKVSLETAIFNSSRLALLLSAFQLRQYGLISCAMQDALHQPFRKHLIPGMMSVIDSALSAGAYGAALSGAGPSIIALVPKTKAGAIGLAMKNKWKKYKVSSKFFALDFESRGALVKR